VSALWVIGLVGTLAWGAGAFGSPYPWAYRPLLAAVTVLGVAGWWLGWRRPIAHALLWALVLVAIATTFQLVPLPNPILSHLSPHAPPLMAQQSLSFGLGLEQSHSLSIAPDRTRLGLVFFVCLSIFLTGIAKGLTRSSAKHFVTGIALLGTALALFGIVQAATFNGKIYGFWELVQGGAPFGPFVNKNHFAGWMLMGLPVAAGQFFAIVSSGRSAGRGVRETLLWFSTNAASRALLSAFAVAIMMLSLAMTVSRSGMLAFIAATLFGVAVVIRRRDVHRTLLIAYVLVMVVGAVSWAGVDPIVRRFAQLDLMTNIDQRPAIWADTTRIAKDFWLTGTGLNTFGAATPGYQTSTPNEHLREAHSDYLQIAAEGGVLLTVPVVVAIGALVIAVRRRIAEDEGSMRWIRIGAMTALVAIAVQSLVEFSLQMPGNAALFAGVAGLAVHDGRRL
jgi:O-antigen ligase